MNSFKEQKSEGRGGEGEEEQKKKRGKNATTKKEREREEEEEKIRGNKRNHKKPTDGSMGLQETYMSTIQIPLGVR